MQSENVDALPAKATEGHRGGALRKVLYAGAALVGVALFLGRHGGQYIRKVEVNRG